MIIKPRKMSKYCRTSCSNGPSLEAKLKPTHHIILPNKLMAQLGTNEFTGQFLSFMLSTYF